MSLSKLVEMKTNNTSFEVPVMFVPDHNMTVQETTHKLFELYKDKVIVTAAIS